jgi:hypothetical protein
VSYEVMCHCGQFLRGERQRRHQVMTCANCSRRVFVLPRSPFEVVLEDSASGITATPRSWLRSWTATLVVGAVSVGLLLVAFLVAWPYLPRKEEKSAEKVSTDAKGLLLKKVEAGREALEQGKFHRARTLLDEAVRERDRQRDLLSPAEHRRLNQLRRQADLLARLSPLSLQEIVRQGTLERDPKEWALAFERYRGWSFVFDDVVRRDAEGRLKLANDVVDVNGGQARLALDELAILKDLPLDDAPRLIFGARLAKCELEEGGTWVIHFEPNSGVLLTDPEAAQAASTRSLEPGLKATLKRQQEWLDELGSEPLKRP